MPVDSATAKALNLKAGSWYNSDNKWYKYGEDQAYSEDQFKDATQPGWRTAPLPSGLSTFTGALGNTSGQGQVNYYTAGKLVDRATYDNYLAQNPKTTPVMGDVAKQLAAATSKPADVSTSYTKPVTPAPSASMQPNSPLVKMEPKPVAQAGMAPTAAPAAAAAPTAPAAQAGPVTITPRPVSPEVQAVLAQLQAKINAAPVTADQIMASQEYQAQAKAIDDMAQRNIGTTTANIRRALSSRNMIRSTPAIQALTDAEGGISLKANADKAAMIPSMLANAYNRQQTELKNYGDLLSTMSGLDNTSFNQGVTQFQATAPYNMLTKGQEQSQKNYETEYADQKAAAEAKAKADSEKAVYENAWKEAEQTGVYFDPAATQLANRLITLKEQATKLAESGNVAESNRISSEEAEPIRAQLRGMGIDADALFGSGVTVADAKKNINQLGVWTLEGRKKEWEMTGVDPATGAKNPDFIIKGLQAEKYAVEAELETLKAELAADPNSGLAAQQKLAIQTKEKELKKLDAEIAATWALANDRNESGSATKAERDAEAAAKKEYDTKVSAYRADYNFSLNGAREWQNLEDLWQPDSEGYQPTLQEKQMDLAAALKKSGISDLDRALMNLLFQASYMGNQTAVTALLGAPYRKRDINPDD